MLVAEHDGRVVGTIAFYVDVRHEGWSNLPAGWAGFRALAVAPRMHGAGIGKALVQHCIERTRDLGAETLGIHTISLLTDAVRLYQRLGFLRCPEFDLRAADIFPSEHADEMVGLAFRLDVEPRKPRPKARELRRSARDHGPIKHLRRGRGCRRSRLMRERCACAHAREKQVVRIRHAPAGAGARTPTRRVSGGGPGGSFANALGWAHGGLVTSYVITKIVSDRRAAGSATTNAPLAWAVLKVSCWGHGHGHLPLAPVDAVRITILMDNVTDPLLFLRSRSSARPGFTTWRGHAQPPLSPTTACPTP